MVENRYGHSSIIGVCNPTIKDENGNDVEVKLLYNLTSLKNRGLLEEDNEYEDEEIIW